ncbi:LPP20 family lipoprotein [Fluviispira vulneris]|uniref:LPP20 family lipoprotein n=1 Tax=Fluviispira vulneris TaxID=2763012 RepID=UPI0016442D58|nr:LPP20 family lipoprotein [Fluviispira vulneris]
MLLKNIILLFSSISISTLALAQTDPCSTLADMQSKNNESIFVGFGAAGTQKEADQNAQIDLARNIRQKVTSSSTVNETNTDATLNSTSKSVVSEVLIGAKVIKRCPHTDSFSSVVTLDRNMFVTSLTEKISTNLKKAVNLKKSLENSKSEEVSAKLIDDAKKFLSDYQENSESDLELCKIYKGCKDLKIDTAFHDLAEIVAKDGDKDQYIFFSSNDDITNGLREELISLIEADNIKVMDGNVIEKSNDLKPHDVKRKIIGNCKVKAGTKIPGSEDRVVETKCTVEAYIGKQKKFRKVYSCKAVGDNDFSNEDAVNSCSGRLQLE